MAEELPFDCGRCGVNRTAISGARCRDCADRDKQWSLDDTVCETCGRVGCVSWSATEGARCATHSSYIRHTGATK